MSALIAFSGWSLRHSRAGADERRRAGVMNSLERRADAGGSRFANNTDSAQAFDRGLAHHRAGRLVEAETCYREVLANEPAHLRALHLLGLLCHQTGRHDTAAEMLHRAILRDSANARLFSLKCRLSDFRRK